MSTHLPEDDFPPGIENMDLGDRCVLRRDISIVGLGTFKRGTKGRLVGPPEGLHISVNGVLGEVLIDGANHPCVLCEGDFQPSPEDA